MGLQLVTPPTAPPVSLALAKRHCRVDHSDDDTLIDTYIAAATAALDGNDGVLGRALMPQTWDLFWDEFPCDAIRIPLPPLISVASVSSLDSGGVYQPIAPANYYVDTSSTYGWVVPVGEWPTGGSANSVRIRFQAGYPLGVPQSIVSAILLMVGELYEHRATNVVGATVADTLSMQRLMSPYRIIF